MEEIAISKFKATCLAVLEKVRTTRQPVLVTRFGKPIAEVTPAPLPKRPDNWLGSMKGTAVFPDELVETPAVPEEEWEVLSS